MQEKRLLWEPLALLALYFVGWGNLLGGAIDPPISWPLGMTPHSPHFVPLRTKFTFCH